MPDLNLADIEARAAAATQGPWERSKAYRVNVVAPRGFIVGRVRDLFYNQEDVTARVRVTSTLTDAIAESANAANSEFIAHARTDVPLLVAAVREKDAELAGKDARIGELEREVAYLKDCLDQDRPGGEE